MVIDTAKIASSIASDSAVEQIITAIRHADRQALVAEKETEIKPFLLQMQDRVQRAVFQTAQKWSVWQDDGPVIFADNCKLFYRKGDSVAVIIEQPPKVRTVIFDSRLISKESAELDRTFTFNLAFPYLNFLFGFRNGLLASTFLFYMNERLVDMGQKPLAPNLTNINHDSFIICHGQGVPNLAADRGNYAKQIDSVINHYWSSKFTKEWDVLYWGAQSLDTRIATPRKWEENSRTNPLFPLAVPWGETPYPSFRHAISMVWHDDTKVLDLQKEIFTEIVDVSITQMQDAFLNIGVGGDITSSRNALKTVLEKLISNALESGDVSDTSSV